MTSPLAEHGAALAPLMRRAGFRYVFLGIENILESDLAFLKAGAKNTHRERGPHGRQRDDRPPSITCIATACYVVGGLIVGNPDDTRESIEANLEFRAPLRGLALHPASDAVPAHADDGATSASAA